MQKYFIIRALDPEFGEAEFNNFCRQAKIVGVEKHFVADGRKPVVAPPGSAGGPPAFRP